MIILITKKTKHLFYKISLITFLFYQCLLSNVLFAQYDNNLHYNLKTGFISNHIKGFAFDDLGFLWIGTESGIARFNGSVFKYYNLIELFKDYSSENRVSRVIKYNDGSVHLYVNDNVYKAYGDKIIKLDDNKKKESLTYFNRNYYINSFNFECNDSTLSKYLIEHTEFGLNLSQKYELFCQYDGLQIITPKAKKSIFLIGKNIYQLENNLEPKYFDGNKWIKVPNNQSTESKRFNTIKTYSNNLNDNSIFIVADSSLYKLTMDTSLGQADIIDLNIKITSSKFVRFIVNSADGGAIYYTLEGNGFFKIPCELGYQTSLIRSDGEMALMNFGDSSFLRKKGQIIYTNGKIKELVPVVILRNTNYFRINSRLQTEQKIIAHNADKLYLVEGKKVSLLKTDFGAKLLAVDKLNRIWIYSTDDILLCCQLDMNNVIKVLKKNTLSKNNPLIYLKPIDSGILMIDNKGSISIINHNDKIKQLCQNNAFKLTRDVISLNSDILIGTYGMGLFLCSKGQVRQLPSDNRKSLTYINCFSRNGDFLEISTNNGLFELHLPLIEKFKKGTIQQIPYLDIGKSTSANLLDIEFNGGCFPCYTKFFDYNAYPTAIGVLLNKKNKSLTHIEKPRFRISHVNGQSINNKLLIHLDEYTNHTKINILTSYHGNYNNLYADLSINNMTSKIDNKLLLDHQIEITGLKSGINICKIKIYNQKWIYESTFIVYVPNLWYKEIKYQILLFTSILIIIWSFKNYRIKNLVNKNKKLDSIIHEKSKDLKENLVLLEEKNHELKREIELKSNVVTLINHDILGPLRFTSLVINELAQENNDHNSEKLKQISNSINGMYTNSHGLLNWLLINSNRLEPRYTEINLENFLTERCDYYQALIYNTTITKYFLNKTIMVKADTNILTSCINNLIENASKYKNENDVSVRIVSQTELKIVISNAVKNFPKRLIKTINNKPELLIGKIKYKEGVGLGLSIYLLNLMQWRLKVNVNKGRVYFVIYIPS